ncbi:hypothetical protein SPSYN_03010 [Sporotomaculum syntrophicum]|uniref:DUF4349 domain-containing protein n=1 Tax=Sporotomaculum syntrophicum TaxID=182264 RepID=A0A9D2WME1_9FIRM|nr:DUF4349 domain-containing protein [Sporotomaculum syntrophicum]KAF1083854.1 hypothetical protein SPSYN_03010 [Sporotomaculum syntrophicum]
MRKLLLFTLAVLLLLTVSGCGSATKNTNESVTPSGQYANQTADMSTEQREKTEAKEDRQSSMQKKIITTVNLVLIVYDVDKTVIEIENILKKVDGYIQTANLWHTNEQPRGSLVLRLSAEMIDESLPRLEALGQVEKKNITRQDVAEEYYDAEARKNNLKKQEERYLELLSKANTVKDMLEIENQLTRVRGEIESFEARLKLLNSQVDLATINLELRSPQSLPTGETLREPFVQRLQAGWQRGVNGMSNLVQDLLVLAVILVPYIPILALGGYLTYRLYKARLAIKKSSDEKQ